MESLRLRKKLKHIDFNFFSHTRAVHTLPRSLSYFTHVNPPKRTPVNVRKISYTTVEIQLIDISVFLITYIVDLLIWFILFNSFVLSCQADYPLILAERKCLILSVLFSSIRSSVLFRLCFS